MKEPPEVDWVDIVVMVVMVMVIGLCTVVSMGIDGDLGSKCGVFYTLEGVMGCAMSKNNSLGR